MTLAVVLAAVLVAAAAIDASPLVRVPVGLVAAIATLAQDIALILCALVAALGIAIGRLLLALAARRARNRPDDAPPLLRMQRAALERQLAATPNGARLTFAIAAAPGVPRELLFPVLGRGRHPLGPALAGTVVGKAPIVLISSALFALLGLVGTRGDRTDASVLLCVVAVLLLVLRTISSIDWQHRAGTGHWRAKPRAGTVRTAAWFGVGGAGPFGPGPGTHDVPADEDYVEGEVLGEELVEDPSDVASPPRPLPPGAEEPGGDDPDARSRS